MSLQQIADLQPVILVGLIILLYSVETFFPYLQKPNNKKQHDIHNFILSFISFAVNGFIGLAVLFMVNLTAEKHLGLLNLLNLPDVIKVILSIFLLDFGSYCFHNLQHKIPILWRFHRVHHSDLYLNTSSALRFHPLDVILSQGIFFCIWIPIIGVPISAFIIYGTIAICFVVMQHTNLKFPAWIEKYDRYVFSTPGWHKIHHANEQKFTDSHYGDVFTFWDRIFGTWHPVQPEDIKFGLKEFEPPEKQKAGFLIRSPFMNL